MNLIDKFENSPEQNVETFNRIFKLTPLLGFDDSEEVEIGGIVSAGCRSITVGGRTFSVNLREQNYLAEEKKQRQEESEKLRKEKANLPSIFKTLNPSQFMIYSAIKELGEVHGISELARNISLSSKTIYNNLPELCKLGLLKTEKVISTSGDFLKISIDTSNQLG